MENKSRFYFISIYGRDLSEQLGKSHLMRLCDTNSVDFDGISSEFAQRFIVRVPLYKFLDRTDIKLRGRKSNADKIGDQEREKKSNLVVIRYTHFHLHTRKNVIRFYENPREREEKIPWESHSK